MAKNGAPIVGATPSRPGQLIFSSTPRCSAVAAEHEHEQLAGDHDHDRPARQQRRSGSTTTIPEIDQQAVDDRVEQRPEPAVLAGQARGDAVEVVGPADDREQHRGRARSMPSGLESASTRNTGISARRTKPIALGSVHGFSGWSDERRRRRRSGAVDPEQPARGETTLGSAHRAPLRGASRHSSATASAAPSTRHAPRLPAAAHLDLDLARRQRALADGEAQRAAEQLGVGELLARARRRGRRRASAARASRSCA